MRVISTYFLPIVEFVSFDWYLFGWQISNCHHHHRHHRQYSYVKSSYRSYSVVVVVDNLRKICYYQQRFVVV